MKVLITGGSGFIGSHCVDAFCAAGHSVVIFDKVAPIHTPTHEHIVGDLRDDRAIQEAVKRCDMVVHAGGLLGTHETVLTAADAVNININGTLNVLTATAKHERKLINISKPNVWLNPYSITKDCCEKFSFMQVDEFNAQVAIVKLYNVYGPRQKYNHVRKAIPTWIVDALNGRAAEIFGSGLATIDLIHVSDTARGIVAVAENFEACRLKPTIEIADNVYSCFSKHNQQILELGEGEAITVKKSLDVLATILGGRIEVKHLPMRRGEVDCTRLCANTDRMNALTGFRTRIGLTEGLRETVDYYRSRLREVAAGVL